MHIVFAGAGHASLIALDTLARRSPPLSLTLVSDHDDAHYSGMIPGWIEGIYPDNAMAIPLAPFCAKRGIRFVEATITGADDAAIHTPQGPIPFDILVLSVGAQASLPPIDGAGNLIGAKPTAGLIEGLQSHADASHVAILGAGPAGLEAAFALRRRPPSPAVTIVEQRGEILTGFPAAFRARVLERLAQAEIALRMDVRFVALQGRHLTLSDDTFMEADAVFAFTGAAPPKLLNVLPFAKAEDGFIAVRNNFVSTSHPNVLAVGDVATRVSDPRPKAGVFAVRTGRPLARAVEALAAGTTPQPVKLQRRALVLLSTGGRRAIGVRNGIVAEGRWVWRWKDKLDQDFVKNFAGE